jgi:AraC family ethanolamine operon transcriptional activator
MKSKSFRDFDAFAAAIRDIDCSMMIQNAAQNRWSVKQTQLGNIDVQFGTLGSGNIVEGQSWREGYLLYLPLTDATEYRANGKLVDRNAILVLEPGCEFFVSTKSKHDWCTVFIPTSRLIGNSGPSKPLVAPSHPETSQCRVTRPNLQLANWFGSAVNQIMTAAANASRFDSSAAAEAAAEELSRVAGFVLGQDCTNELLQKGRPSISRPGIIGIFQELLEARADRPLRVDELAAAAGVSERTLYTIFQEYFGVGPRRFLQLRQLHQVRRALRSEDPGQSSVSNVLTKYGVWEFGRFAGRYGRLFGERPSETLHRIA